LKPISPSCGRIRSDGAKWGPPKVAVTATGLTLIGADGGNGGKLMAWEQDICG